MEKGAASNHIIISSNYHKFLSSYCHSLAKQGYTPARVYLQLPPGNSPVGSSYFFVLNQCPEAVAAAKTNLIPFLIGQKATHHHLPAANNCRDKHLPWLCTSGSLLNSLIYLLLSITYGSVGSAELKSCTCAQFCYSW